MRTRIDNAATATVIGLAAVIAIARFIAIDAGSDSASDTLRPWAIQVAVIAAVAAVAILGLRRWTRSLPRP